MAGNMSIFFLSLLSLYKCSFIMPPQHAFSRLHHNTTATVQTELSVHHYSRSTSAEEYVLAFPLLPPSLFLSYSSLSLHRHFPYPITTVQCSGGEGATTDIGPYILGPRPDKATLSDGATKEVPASQSCRLKTDQQCAVVKFASFPYLQAGTLRCTTYTAQRNGVTW